MAKVAQNDQCLRSNRTGHDICHGKPYIRSWRYPAEESWKFLSAGMTIEEIFVTTIYPRGSISVQNFDKNMGELA
jgi:hypothetical protein